MSHNKKDLRQENCPDHNTIRQNTTNLPRFLHRLDIHSQVTQQKGSPTRSYPGDNNVARDATNQRTPFSPPTRCADLCALLMAKRLVTAVTRPGRYINPCNGLWLRDTSNSPRFLHQSGALTHAHYLSRDTSDVPNQLTPFSLPIRCADSCALLIAWHVWCLKPTYTVFSTNQVRFVEHEQVDVLHVLSLLPAPRQHVPLVRCADDHVTLETKRIGYSRQISGYWSAAKSWSWRRRRVALRLTRGCRKGTATNAWPTSYARRDTIVLNGFRKDKQNPDRQWNWTDVKCTPRYQAYIFYKGSKTGIYKAYISHNALLAHWFSKVRLLQTRQASPQVS